MNDEDEVLMHGAFATGTVAFIGGMVSGYVGFYILAISLFAVTTIHYWVMGNERGKNLSGMQPKP